jgi:nitrogenase molybdenum-iron protein beta chain
MTEPLRIKDHNTLFQGEEYEQMAARKATFENAASPVAVAETLEWTKTAEYQEKNFARESLVINPVKACQPLGAVLAALGFEGTLPFVHGSQGCVSYFRSHLSRHFKEPCPAVSSSMTEDAAVFGGLKNMLEGLENANTLYQPKVIAVATTCMAEVIGDDLNSFIKNAKSKGAIPADKPVPFAHTPSFVGSHLTGYDSMLKSFLAYFGKTGTAKTPGRLNIIPGFDTYTGNLRELSRILNLMDVEFTVLADYSDRLDSPATGTYDPYTGGTPIAQAEAAPGAAATVALQKWSTHKTLEYVAKHWQQETVAGPTPIGVGSTDQFLMTISRLTGKPIPDALAVERGRLIDAMADSHAYIHGKRLALVGDPDMLLGLISFYLELGAEPVHIVCSNGDKEFKAAAEALLAASPYGQAGKVYIGKDLWHLRSLMFTDPVDLLIGNTHAKFVARETGTPLVRVGFPIFDRHHLHRYPIIGYQGALNLLTWTVNIVLDELDRGPLTSFDAIR